tara:strand:- start:3600 stop:4889 length:1290 start_codon:yes stop_codon:yes gene_type:complete
MSNTVPEGWRESSIGEITSKDSLFCDGDWVESKDQDQAGSNRLIQLADVGDGVFVNKSSRFMNDEQFDRLKCTALKKNDILIARMPDPLGRACLYPLKAGRAATVVDVAVIRTQNADHYWLMSAINSSEFRYQIDLNASGTTRTRIARGTLSQIKVLEPPLPEQQKIAAILSSVDDVIEKTRTQIDKLKDLKTGLIQELLTKGIGHTEFKNSPVGRIPVAWDFDELLSLSVNGISNGIFNDPKKVGKGKKLINVYDMYQGFGVKVSSLKLADVDDKEFNRNKVEFGDVFFTRSSLKLEGIAYCNINLSHDNDITYDGHLMRVRPDKSRVSPKYLAYFCLTDHSRKFFMAAAKHSTMTTIGQADIAPLKVALPPLPEQEKIVSIIDAVEEKIRAASIRLLQTEALKKALMQDLLTGKVRVKVDQKESAVA